MLTTGAVCAESGFVLPSKLNVYVVPAAGGDSQAYLTR
jgi:hypothetical protein